MSHPRSLRADIHQDTFTSHRDVKVKVLSLLLLLLMVTMIARSAISHEFLVIVVVVPLLVIVAGDAVNTVAYLCSIRALQL